MARRPLIRSMTAPVLAGMLTATAVTAAPAQAGTAAQHVRQPGCESAATSTWKPRPAQYTQTVVTKDLAIPMSDGVKLRGDLTLPAGADGKAISTKVPVVVTITAYNKTVIAGGFGGTLAGADPATSSSAATPSSPSTHAAPVRARASGTRSARARTRTAPR